MTPDPSEEVAFVPHLSRDRTPADTTAFEVRGGRRCFASERGVVTDFAP